MRTTLTAILTALALALPATAGATPRLSMHAGRTSITRAVRSDIHGQPGATGHVGRCWRRTRQEVACNIYETNVTFGGVTGWDLSAIYSVTGRHGKVYLG